MGWVGSWYGLVWFGQNSEAEFKTMNQLINDKGGYRAARAAKKDVKKSDIDKNIITGQNILVEPHLLLKYD